MRLCHVGKLSKNMHITSLIKVHDIFFDFLKEIYTKCATYRSRIATTPMLPTKQVWSNCANIPRYGAQ